MTEPTTARSRPSRSSGAAVVVGELTVDFAGALRARQIIDFLNGAGVACPNGGGCDLPLVDVEQTVELFFRRGLSCGVTTLNCW